MTTRRIGLAIVILLLGAGCYGTGADDDAWEIELTLEAEGALVKGSSSTSGGVGGWGSLDLASSSTGYGGEGGFGGSDNVDPQPLPWTPPRTAEKPRLVD